MHLLCTLHYWIKIVLILYSTFGSCNASLGIQTTKTTPTLRRNKNVLYNTELNLSCTCEYYIRPLIHIYRRFHGCLNHCFFHIRYCKLTFCMLPLWKSIDTIHATTNMIVHLSNLKTTSNLLLELEVVWILLVKSLLPRAADESHYNTNLIWAWNNNVWSQCKTILVRMSKKGCKQFILTWIIHSCYYSSIENS